MVFTPEVAEVGVGDLKDDRLRRSVEQLASAFEMARQPAPQEIFDRRFLPPLAERKLSFK
jgi:NitT/TauT family transport system substrate-binding protein